MSSIFQIDKLDESNYPIWNIQMKSLLVHSDLWNVVSGRELKPEDAASASNLMYETRNEKALASILLCVKANQVNHIKNCVSALEAWRKLKEIHQPKGPARKIMLFKKLLHLSMQEGGNMSAHINDFSTLIDQLSEIEVAVPDEMLVILLLSSLPKAYEGLVIAMESRDSLPDLASLKVKLLEEGARQQEANTSSNSNEVLNIARSSGGYNTSKQYGEKKQQSDQNRDKNNNNFNDRKCYNCGRRGHFAAKCKNKDKHSKHDKRGEFSYSVSLAAIKSMKNNNIQWCVDSGASSHFCCDYNMFEKYEKCDENVYLPNNNSLKAIGRGNVVINDKEKKITLRNVLHVPELKGNFISISKMIKSGKIVVCKDNFLHIKDKENNSVLKAFDRNGIFIYEIEQNKCMSVKLQNNFMNWHLRYGHVNFNCLKEMAKHNLVKGLQIKDFHKEPVCETCSKAKIAVKPFEKSQFRAKSLLELVHSDICGPINTTSLGGSRYFATFIDDKSRFTVVFCLKTKDQVFNAFKEYKALAEKQTGCHIKCLRSDNGREYVNKEFNKFLIDNGIRRQLTVPYTPQQNGVAERANRTLVEMSRSMLLESNLDEKFWAEAVLTSVYLRNRTTTKVLVNKTPFEIWYRFKPSVAHLRIFGTRAIVLDKTHSKKFLPKGKEMIMIGYSEQAKAYKLYEPNMRKVYVSRDVIFVDGKYYQEEGQQNESTSISFGDFLNTNSDNNVESYAVNVENIATSRNEDNNNQLETHDENDAEEIIEDSRGQQSRIGPGRPRLIRTGLVGRPRKVYNTLNSVNIVIPCSVNEAINGPNANAWKAAMQREYASLMKNQTWELTELPKGQKSIGCKWVFTVKEDKAGNVQTFKARLVAKGCSQKYGINYKETFSPVVRYADIRLLVALAVEHELYMHQMDVSTAYLNADLDEEVYMVQPESFKDADHPDKVLRLKKSLYGLKQSGRAWNMKLNNVLIKMGFKKCANEQCMYTRNHDNMFNIIAVYVDDLIIASSSKEELKSIKAAIAKAFDVKDGGQLNHFLGMEFERIGETGSIKVCQRKYITNLLNDFGMQDSKDVATPLEAGFQVNCNNSNCRKVDVTNYQSAIGALMYLAISTRPDILHSVSKLAQRNIDPHVEHQTAVKHVLRYLKKTIDFKLNFEKTGRPTVGYADADWGSDATNRKSYSGFAFMKANCIFSWESKKQNVVALSSTEAEYIALSSAAKEAIYIKNLLEELGFKEDGPLHLYGDNLSAQCLVKNATYHARSKHIDLKYHHVRDVYSKGEIDIGYVPTGEMPSDIFTKNLCKIKHLKFCKSISLY